MIKTIHKEVTTQRNFLPIEALTWVHSKDLNVLKVTDTDVVIRVVTGDGLNAVLQYTGTPLAMKGIVRAVTRIDEIVLGRLLGYEASIPNPVLEGLSDILVKSGHLDEGHQFAMDTSFQNLSRVAISFGTLVESQERDDPEVFQRVKRSQLDFLERFSKT